MNFPRRIHVKRPQYQSSCFERAVKPWSVTSAVGHGDIFRLRYVNRRAARQSGRCDYPWRCVGRTVQVLSWHHFSSLAPRSLAEEFVCRPLNQKKIPICWYLVCHSMYIVCFVYGWDSKLLWAIHWKSVQLRVPDSNIQGYLCDDPQPSIRCEKR